MELRVPTVLFHDLDLARRVEAHEAWSSAEHARAQAERYPETGAASLRIAGGCAVYCGHRSPLSQVYGLGLTGPVQVAGLEAIEAFYRDRGLGVRVRVCPLADGSMLSTLAGRGYELQDFMNVHVRPVKPDDGRAYEPPGMAIRVATLEETQRWFEQLGAGGDWAEPDGVAFMVLRCALKAGTRLYLAWRDGEMAGAGALEVGDGVAALIADATLPAFRRQGVHTALLRARLSAAAEAGCDLAMVHTRPRAASQRNVLRAGFRVAYTTAGLERTCR